MIASSRTLSGRLFSCTYAARKEPTVSFEVVRTLRTVLIFSRPPRALMLLAITSSTLCARTLTGNNATAATAIIGSTVRNIGTDSFPNAREMTQRACTEGLQYAQDSGHACSKVICEQF